MIPENDSVRLLSRFVEEMDLTDLYSTYERIPENLPPRRMLKIVLYSYMNGDFSSRSMQRNCLRDINFMYLLEGLNAAGRLGQTEKAEKLLLSPDLHEAEGLAEELRDLNRERQKIENEIWQDAQAQLKGITPDGPIVLASDSWHQGVIGIAASRLADQYGVPTVMVCFNGDSGKGSCRSCSGFNLYQALAACSEHLESFGGHALAAGLNIRREELPAFREALHAYYLSHLPEKKPDVSCDRGLCCASVTCRCSAPTGSAPKNSI